MITKKILSTAAVITGLFLLAPTSVFAIGNGDISIQPTQASDSADSRTQSWFIYNFLPGTVHPDSVSIRNESSEVRNLKLYSVDGYTTPQGGFALRADVDPKQTIGKWIVLKNNELTLQPGEERAVEFTYTVPSSAEPGEYAGGIVAEDLQKIQGQGIAVVKRVGARVYHTVPGNRNERIALVSSEMKLSPTGRWFEVTVENTGNVSIPLTLQETISHPDGSDAQVLSSTPQTILPKSKVVLKTEEWKNPLLGSFIAKGVIQKDGANLAEVPSSSFLIISPYLIGGVALGVIVVSIIITLLMRKKKKTTRKTTKRRLK